MVAEANSQRPSLDEKRLWRRFQADEGEVRLVNYRRGAFLAMVFILTGSLMDAIAFDHRGGDQFGLGIATGRKK